MFVIFVDKKMLAKDKNAQLYLKGIQKTIPDTVVISATELETIGDIIERLADSQKPVVFLPLKPMSKNMYDEIINQLHYYGEDYDAENLINYNTDEGTATANAIMQVINEQGGLQDKKVCLINKSETVGTPLMYLMINKCRDLLLWHRQYGAIMPKDLEDIDILITATGNDNFSIDADYVRHIPLIIDLSNDISEKLPQTIESVPTIMMLKSMYIRKVKTQLEKLIFNTTCQGGKGPQGKKGVVDK